MKCSDVIELLGDYWDLPESDLRRLAIDEHVKRCPSCAEEFRVWKESAELIRSQAAEEDLSVLPETAISKSVMERIYADESWRVPIQDRLFAIPAKLRFRLMGIIAFCMATFLFAFLYSLTFKAHADETTVFGSTSGLMPVASALGQSKTGELTDQAIRSLPTASLSDPFILKVGSATYDPNYVLTFSLLGLVFALLLLNWFSRTKS